MAFNPRVRGKYIVLGEVNIVVTALRRNLRWITHNYQTDHEDPLITSFNNLKNVLNRCEDLLELEPSIYLSPFLEVVRSEDTTGPITGLALSSINKFLSYNLIDFKSTNIALAVSAMADAVTHARFVGTDPASDEVVLMKILQVLRVLLLTNIGIHLTNEAVCEIMQSCFRICFEMRLSELLRKSAEHTLVDMVQVLFARVPEFKEDLKNPTYSSLRKLKMKAGGMGDTNTRGKRQKRSNKAKKSEQHKVNQAAQVFPPSDEKTVFLPTNDVQTIEQPSVNAIQETNDTNPVENADVEISKTCQESNESPDMTKVPVLATDSNLPDDEGEMADTENGEKEDVSNNHQRQDSLMEGGDDVDVQSQISETSSIQDVDIMNNPRGVRFAPSPRTGLVSGPLLPYGLPCVRELFRFLISLINPHDRHNSDVMIHMGMSLLMVSLEVSRDEIGRFPSILLLVKDDLCRYLFQLLSVDRLGLVAASLRVSLLLFESLRKELKFQLEQFLKKLMDLITSDNPKLSYEAKELSLDAVVQLWHIPGLVTELYLNYDCDFYCSNMFEDLSKLLSKNAFPVSGLYTTHLLSLEALLTVVRSVEQRCNQPNIVRSLSELQLDEAAKGTPSTTPVSTPCKPVVSWASAVPACGQHVGENIVKSSSEITENFANIPVKIPDRFSGEFPTIEELQLIKQKKKILQSGTELFNQKPKKGIAFLQEQNLLAVPLDTREVSKWLRVNPWLDKKMIGEYISDRRNPEILDGFVRTFEFEGLRVDESLRMYLETFRLPGEAPVIQRLIEAFSAYWSECNHHPFMNLDAAFTLSYAIIMLNTDQHNRNVRKQNEPMTMNDFKRNVKGCNGGVDFDQFMLEEIYNTIRNDEIVLPEEQVGPVRDRWLWNVFLRRSSSSEGMWLMAPSTHSEALHVYDRDLFAMNWGPTVSALSYVFDKSLDEQIIQKAIIGFRKCALISAHFGMSDVFDNLIVSLCKFTTLANGGEAPEAVAIGFGVNGKAQLAARTAFHLAHRHGDILREGWKNIFAIILPLYRAELLPTSMVEVEDFVDPTGRISLIREKLPMQRSDSSIFSSFYQFMTLGGGPADNSNQKQTNPEDQEALKLAQECVKELQLETLVTESKFLRLDSLQELIKALMDSSRGPHTYETMGTAYSEDSAIFFLELLLRVVLQNRDRILSLWQMIRDHLYTTIVMATEYSLLLERAVIGLLRLAIRLLHREDVAEEVLASLQILLMIKSGIIPMVSRQIGYGLHELLRTNAANIHSRDDWITIFTVMKCVGAGAVPPPIVQVPNNADLARQPSVDASVTDDADNVDRKTHSDSETAITGDRSSVLSDRGYTSDGELYGNHPSLQVDGNLQRIANSEEKQSTIQVIPPPPTPCNQFTLQLGEELRQHDMRCMVKCCETLAFLIRDAAHVTPDNFELCVRCIRTFVEASINGVNRAHHVSHENYVLASKQDKKKLKRRKDRDIKRKPAGDHAHGRYQHTQTSDDEMAVENVPGGYHTLSLQLLDLMHTLHTRAASIYSSWAEEEKKRTQVSDQPPAITAEVSNLWDKCWCPLLQGIARLCCDARRQVRTSALTYLQRALLVHDLQTLTGKEWESCFNKVLFPLLTKLLENISPADPDGMEETRMRGATLLSKVFLQHLTPLLTLPTFTALWLTILDFMDKYMHVGKRDLLFEAIPESLKNMLLVMDTAGIFHTGDTTSGHTSLWNVTWERIDCFLPNLKNEVFKPPTPEPKQPELVAPKAPEVSREMIPPLLSSHNTPYSPTPPKMHLVAGTPITPAGIIAAPLPKITPPSSLNIAPPPGISLAPPYATPTNPVPIVPYPAASVGLPLGLSPPKHPQLIGLGAPLVSQQQSTISSPAATNILMTPTTPSFLVMAPLPQPTLVMSQSPLASQSSPIDKP